MKILVVAGVRPNFVKVAPLIRAMRQHPAITPILVNTGQHYSWSMSGQFISELGIPEPALNLGVGSGSHALQTAEVMKRLEPVLEERCPDLVLVVGNVMIDAFQMFRPQWEASTILDRLRIAHGEPYAVLTLHRPSNVDDPARLKPLLETLCELARHLPIVFPVHPRVKAQLAQNGNRFCADADSGIGVSENGMICLDPLGYPDFIALMRRARLVLTDSGGL